MPRDVTPMRSWLHSLAGAKSGDAVIDLGCGSGEDLEQLAREIPDLSKLVGLDVSKNQIQQARARFEGDKRAEFICCDVAEGLPFQSEGFDVVYSVNTLECIPDKEGFFKECARILRPSGRIVMAHFDWDTQTFDGSDIPRVRKVVQAFNDWKQDWMQAIDPWAGRRLWRYMQGSGRFEGEISCYTLTEKEYASGRYGFDQAQSFEALVRRGMLSAEEYMSFLSDLELQSRAGQYFYSITMFAYMGARR